MDSRVPWRTGTKARAAALLVAPLALGTLVLTAPGANASMTSRTWEFKTTSQVSAWYSHTGRVRWVRHSSDGPLIRFTNPHRHTRYVKLLNRRDVQPVQAGAKYRFSVMLHPSRPVQGIRLAVVEYGPGNKRRGSHAVNTKVWGKRWHLVSTDYTVHSSSSRLDLRIGLLHTSGHQGVLMDYAKLVQVTRPASTTPASSPVPTVTPVPSTTTPAATPAPSSEVPTPSPVNSSPTTSPTPVSSPVPTATSSAPPTSIPNDDAYVPGWGEPTWRDEFNGTSVDPTKWNVRGRDDLGLLFDAAIPDRNQVTESGGLLHIRGDWLATPQTRPVSSSGVSMLTHKTGYLDQRRLKSGDMSMSQRWGRWEIRCKTPTGPHTLGALAAFWLRNSNSGEIDIMEAWGYDETAAPGGQRIDTETTTVHTNTMGVNNQKYIWHHADYGVTSKPWQAFHTYAFELTPSYAAIVVDGRTIARATPADHPNLWNPSYFGSPLHMRLNLHVGPSAKYWGLPDPSHREKTQPLDYQVDHVRVWAYNPS